ncbi:hypothetical protein HUA74_01135 [Myxococcus sp. CA051A]|uniref:Uncharacterized protein n=1 Tax=Myxococcus llanfairpwllgwyngyllgogerychwyrndrobwllllantysiliogogogochensis TaxID=2590453 RepID=A0A540WLY1_9BACT|nr:MULTISPECIES: hypothetical protein [Myxococcus]NTX12619.1 hypothetical protein [Myxococcus sp. CA056]NTX59255.1 hypothetical protein [Myxococcus sp. CA051A]TQF10026.1 hypothetical protein FJV41_41545 [Myxococcus llanfairpwllgwyngyllgogerychwyrndrobwllllantysiliogogogochensis]
MKLPSRKTLLGNVLSLAAIAWIYGGDLADALRARTADVSALVELPSPVRPAVVLALAALATAVVVLGGLARGKVEDFKGYRLLPILLVGALFADLVLSESRIPIDSTDMASMSLQRFHKLAQALSTQDAVAEDPRVLQPLLEELGRPPYLVRGEPLTAYALQVRKDCEGPVRDAPGVRPGTLLYCVAPERKGAWVTMVGLAEENRFGAPELLSAGGKLRFLLVQPAISDEEQAEPGDAFREVPGPAAEDGTDGGTSSLQP